MEQREEEKKYGKIGNMIRSIQVLEHLLQHFTGYEPHALGLSVDCSSVEGPVDVSRTRLDRLGPTYSSCVDSTLSHHHLLTILPAQDQFTAPDRFTRSAPIFAGSLVVVPSLS